MTGTMLISIGGMGMRSTVLDESRKPEVFGSFVGLEPTNAVSKDGFLIAGNLENWKGCSDLTCRSGTNLHCLTIVIADAQRLPSVRVVEGLVSRIAALLEEADTNRKISLQFAHARFYLVLVDRLPHIGGPVLIELVRILDEEHVVGIEPIVATLFGSDRRSVELAAIFEHCENLALSCTLR